MNRDTMAVVGLGGCALAFVLALLVGTGGLVMLLTYGSMSPSAPDMTPSTSAPEVSGTEAVSVPEDSTAAPPETPPAAAKPPPAEAKPSTVVHLVDSSNKLKLLVDQWQLELAAAKAELAAGNYSRSQARLQQILHSARSLPYQRRSELKGATHDGRDLNAWLETIEAEYWQRVDTHGKALLAGLSARERDIERSTAFVRTFRRESRRVSVIDSLLSALDPFRAEVAEKQLRVMMPGTIRNPYRAALQAGLRKKWPDDIPYEISFEPVLGAAESSAVWKVLQPHVREGRAQYQSADGKHRQYLVNEVTVQFRVSRSSDMPSNWAELPPLTVSVRPPPKLDLADRTAVETSQREMIDNLAAELAKKLEHLPTFQLFPNIDLTSASLVKQNQRLDFQVAAAMQIRDPDRLQREFRRLQQENRDPALHRDLCRCIIRKDLDEHAEWVKKQTDLVNQQTKHQLLLDLRRNPTFADYSLLLHLLQSDTRISRDVIRILAPQMKQSDRVRNALLARCLDRSYEYRSQAVRFFLRNLSEPDQAEYEPWIADQDTELAKAAYQTYRSLSRNAANRLILKYYPEAQSAVRREMLHGLQYNAKTYDRRVLAYLAAAAAAPDAGELRQTARQSLAKSCADPDAWLAYAQVAQKLTGEEQAEAYVSLIGSIYRARPEQADTWLFKLAAANHRKALSEAQAQAADKPTVYQKTPAREIREHALAALMVSSDQRQAHFTNFAKMLRQDLHDLLLLRHLAKLIADSYRRKHFSLDNDAVRWVVATANTDPSSYASRKLFFVYKYAISENIPGYRQLAEKAIKASKNSHTRRYLQRLLPEPTK